MRQYTIPLLFLCLFLPPVCAQAKVINAIAAIVNDDIITLNDVFREAQPALRDADIKSPLDDASRSKIRQSTLDHMVEKKLVEQKVRELNIRIGDEEINQAIDDVKRQNKISSPEAFKAALASQGLTFEQYRAQLQEQLEKLRLISMEVRAKIQVGESEMRDYYQTNLAKYTEEESFHARQIYFHISDKASLEESKRAKESALAVLAEARSGKDFIELARSHSDDAGARKDGGDLGIFKKGDMLPELEQTILSLKPGEISELITTPAGLHIIKLEERITGKTKPFESLKAEIEDIIYRKKSEERFNQWAKELRSKAIIDIKELKGLL